MWALARDIVLEQRMSVVLDSPASTPMVVEKALALAERSGASLRVVLTHCDRALRSRRMAERQPKASQPVSHEANESDARWRFGHLPTDTIAVDTAQPLADTVALSIRALGVQPRVSAIQPRKRRTPRVPAKT